MSNTIEWFRQFQAKVAKTPTFQQMSLTVEDSPWHREANVMVHTEMCVDHYITNVAKDRTERQQMLTLMSLLFHDTGKPAAEETLEKKDGSGKYRRYAGHEPLSANMFINFMYSHDDFRQDFFDQGYTANDIRLIKFMIENHLPYGITNVQKRINQATAIRATMVEDLICFFDQLWSDANGRISDDHQEKLDKVVQWVEDFKYLKIPDITKATSRKMMAVLVGAPGIGKSTWIKNNASKATIISEDTYRLDFHYQSLNEHDCARIACGQYTEKQRYADAFQHMIEQEKGYNEYVNARLAIALSGPDDKLVVLDRTNLSRKSRSKWISAAKAQGYTIRSVEFYHNVQTVLDRQATRPDKAVPLNRVEQMYYATETPWRGVEVDYFTVIEP